MDLRAQLEQLTPLARRFVHRLGWLGGAGALMAVLAVVEVVTVGRPAAGEAAELEAQLIRLRESPRNRREIDGGPSDDAAAQLEAFARFFPLQADMNRMIGEIHQAAKKEKLALERGDYRLSEEAGIDIVRYQITLPVKGRYSAIRAFLRRVLRDMPAVSLDGVGLQRQSAGEDVVEAQIRLSVFYRGER